MSGRLHARPRRHMRTVTEACPAAAAGEDADIEAEGGAVAAVEREAEDGSDACR